MPQDIKIWEIKGDIELKEVQKTPLDLEKRLEDWIAKDISIVSEDYLIIGRQVVTAFGKLIDLLCLDANGDVVILELKRDKTPRDVVAQALDYASWVNDLSREDILSIAQSYSGFSSSLDEVFKKKFKIDLPETINGEHSIIIVASEIDASTERIVRYLSDKHNVAINVIQFQYHKNSNNEELLSRIFLIKPEIVQSNVIKTSSKRRNNLTVAQLQAIADDNNVGEIYKKIFDGVFPLSDGIHTTQSSVGFLGKNLMQETKKNVFFNLIPTQSDASQGLKFQIYLWRIARYFNTQEQIIEGLLPKNATEWHYSGVLDPEWSGKEGFFKTIKEAEDFIEGLKNRI